MTRGRRRQPQRNPGRGKVVPFAIANYWGDEYNLAPTTVNQVKLLACTPQAPASADLQTNPLEQEATIVRIEGHIEFTNPSVTGNYDVYAGIYLASYDDTDVSFATQDPLVVADVMRPNWLALHVLTVDMSTTAHSTSAQRVSFSLNIRRVHHPGSTLDKVVVVENGCLTSTSVRGPPVSWYVKYQLQSLYYLHRHVTPFAWHIRGKGRRDWWLSMRSYFEREEERLKPNPCGDFRCFPLYV